jgi:hypothetical protein
LVLGKNNFKAIKLSTLSASPQCSQNSIGQSQRQALLL